jgi:hypothetical protein
MSSIASAVTKTVTKTAASTAASATSTLRAKPQGGVLEGSNPTVWDSSNPIILFIIQVRTHPADWRRDLQNVAQLQPGLRRLSCLVFDREARDSDGSFALKRICLDYVPYCALLTYIAGRNHYHLLPSPPLAPLQTATASSHRRSYWRNHTWSLGHDAYTRIPKCHIPSSSNAHTQSRCQSGVDLVSLSSWFGSQYEDVPHELAGCAKCGVRGDGPSFRIGMRYCLGSLQPIQN